MSQGRLVWGPHVFVSLTTEVPVEIPTVTQLPKEPNPRVTNRSRKKKVKSPYLKVYLISVLDLNLGKEKRKVSPFL